MRPETLDGDGIIIYDGDCLLCSRWVQWVVRHDPGGIFRFTAIASLYGRAMALRLGIDPENPATNAVVVDGRAYLFSDAAITIASHLPGWGWVSVFRFVPKPLRDAVYKLIARNRISWFGRPEACDLPGPEVRARIIEG